jgi:hypothetical protein
MLNQVRRWLPGRRLVLVSEGGLAAVALPWVQTHLVRVSRWRGDAALFHRPGPQSPGTRGPKPPQGKRQRGLQEWAGRSDTPWEAVEVPWYGGQREQAGVFSRMALWSTPLRRSEPIGASRPPAPGQPGHRPHDARPVGPVLTRHGPGLAAEPRRAALGTHDRLVSP